MNNELHKGDASQDYDGEVMRLRLGLNRGAVLVVSRRDDSCDDLEIAIEPHWRADEALMLSAQQAYVLGRFCLGRSEIIERLKEKQNG